jgi:hypothetical protein
MEHFCDRNSQITNCALKLARRRATVLQKGVLRVSRGEKIRIFNYTISKLHNYLIFFSVSSVSSVAPW